MHRRLLLSRRRSLGQQGAFLHRHHERIWHIRCRCSFEVKRRAFGRHQSWWDRASHSEGDVGALGLVVVFSARDVKLGGGSLYDPTFHLQRKTLYDVPHFVGVFLGTSGKEYLSL